MKQKKPMPAMYLPKEERLKEEVLVLTPCINPKCPKPKKPIEAGYYGSFEEGGVCCRQCNTEYMEARSEQRFLQAATGTRRQASD